MVSIRDRALVEARAKGLDVEAALRHPFRQLLKLDIVVSAFAVSVMLLIYYTAVGFSLIYLTTVFGFSVKDGNGLGNWNWGFNVIAVLLVGIISDRFRVRKPFMVLGGVIAAVMVVVYLKQALPPRLLHDRAYAGGNFPRAWHRLRPVDGELHRDGGGQEPGAHRNRPGDLGWIQRLVVFVSFLVIPAVVSSVTPLVTYGSTVQAYAAQGAAAQLAFAQAHPAVVADAQKVPPTVLATAAAIPPTVTSTAAKIPPTVLATASTYSTQLANAVKFAPELTVIQAHPALFTKLAAAPSNPALQAQAIAAAGGGAKGLGVLTTIAANQAAINGVIAVGPQLQTVAPYAADLHGHRPVLGPAENHRAVLDRADGHRPVQRAADGPVQGAAGGDRLPHRPRRRSADGRRRHGGPVEDLVLDLLRRNHRLPALDPAAARPVAHQGRQARRGRARGPGPGGTGQAQRLSSTPELTG